ncbi:MAG: hypothetical protein ACREOO_01125 [bacterium]
MASSESKKVVLQTTCAQCRMSFHLSATPKSEKEGEEEIVVTCPECGTPLVVTVPRRLLAGEYILRGARIPSVTSRKQ